ncbi:DUF4255 domain-containing protein [Pleionea sp. CnH1-48]|uniref:DUF4255 domain-containing protein n=1 Tax=Pleionea sp. CnH1-48 TaxID=2954494 RepID=UPI0020978435|nr:DUF4255 domain-containing protein [Pleionea sp. CnH1-48]MCO7223335.1 DUF4255 domain-containing protein [Pleionea sp. CnH1-48]
MASYSVLHDISKEIQTNLYNALVDTPDTDFSLTDADTDIILAKPDDADSDSGKISLYLYHMDINAHLRNQPMVAIGAEALVNPPLPFRLRYLLTPVTDSHVTNQLLLGRLIQFLYDNPLIQSSAELTLNDDRGGSTELRIHPDSLSVESLNQLWTAMNEAYRLSYSFSVDVVPIDSAKQPAAAHRVGVSQGDLSSGVDD